MNNQDRHNRHLSIPAVTAFWGSLFALSWVWFLWDPPRVFSHAIVLVLPALLLAVIGFVSTIWKRESVRGLSYAIAAIVLISGMAVYAYPGW